jgi:hypothetical protein
MRIAPLRPRRLAIAALPLAFVAGAGTWHLHAGAAGTWHLRGQDLHDRTSSANAGATYLREDVVCELDAPGQGAIEGATGWDDLDGDGELDRWARWAEEGSCCAGGDLMVWPGGEGAAWQTSEARRDHLTVVVVPRAAGAKAAPAIAEALWGSIMIDSADDWLLADNLHAWLIEGNVPAADAVDARFGDPVDRRAVPRVEGGADFPLAFRHATVMTPRQAIGWHLLDAIDARDAAAVLVAHLDGACEHQQVARCAGGASVWRTGDHVAWMDAGGDWRWIYATEGAYDVGDISCAGEDMVLIPMADGVDHRVVAIDVAAMRRATFEGVTSVDVDGADITMAGENRRLDLTLDTLRRDVR